MQPILLVEDNLDLRSALVGILSGFCTVTVAGSIKEAKDCLASGEFNLILLDVGLPDGEGFKLCSYMQQHERLKSVPVIFLTGRAEIDDKLLAFSVGADDYIIKPFDSRELRARVEARLKKSVAQKQSGREFRRGDLRFCLDSQRVYIQDENENETRAELTAIEFKLLVYFANHVEHVLSRNQVLNAVWGEGVFISDRTVDSHISKLRKKISASRCQISPVQGEGYRFIPSGKSTA